MVEISPNLCFHFLRKTLLSSKFFQEILYWTSSKYSASRLSGSHLYLKKCWHDNQETFCNDIFSYSRSLTAVCTARTYSRSDLCIFNFLLRENKTKDRQRRMNRSFCSVLSIYFRSVCLVRKHGNNTIVLHFQGLVSCGTYTVLQVYNNANEVAQASHVTSTHHSLLVQKRTTHQSSPSSQR